MTKVINLFAGPGTGKSTAAAAIFSELKQRGVNAELVTEVAKDAAWEKRSKKFFMAQQYIYGKQSWRMERVRDEVDVIVTDCPLMLGTVYMPDDFPIPSLRTTIREDFDRYDNLNIFLARSKAFNPKGRNQDYQEAVELDHKIKKMLLDNNIPFFVFDTGRLTAHRAVDKMLSVGWSATVPALENTPSSNELNEVVQYFNEKEVPVIGTCPTCKGYGSTYIKGTGCVDACDTCDGDGDLK